MATPGESAAPPLDVRLRALLVAGLVAYAGVLAVVGSHAAGGSDSAGYLGSARLLSRGEFTTPVRVPEGVDLDRRTAAVFIPLGFAQGRNLGSMSPSYPAGFPAHMAVLARLLGERTGPFLVVPIASAAALWLLYRMARELGVSAQMSLLGTTLLAISPTWLLLSLQPMSDVPATAWALATLLIALRARQQGRWAPVAGFGLGLAVVVRPSNALLVLPLAFALPWRWKRIVAFGLGGLPVLAALLMYNWASYGSPMLSGYGPASQADLMFRLEYFPVRFRHYGFWTAVALGPWIPLAWLASVALRGRALRERLLLLAWFLPPFLFHCFYMPYDPWWFTRFFLPAFPALLIGAAWVFEALGARTADRLTARTRRMLVIAACLVALAWPAVATLRLGVLRIGYLESIYPEAVEWARQKTSERSVILASQMSGAVYLYSDRIVANPGKLNAYRLEKLMTRLEASGYTLYALLFPHEIVAIENQRPGRWTRIGDFRDVSLWKREPPELRATPR